MLHADLRLVAIDAGVWLGLSVVVGALAPRLPVGVVDRDSPLTTIRSFEREGALWRRVGVHRWKDGLPEAGTLFGGASKRRLPRAAVLATGEAVSRFARETRRAELVHWTLLAASPLFALWNPPGLAAAMVVFGVVANTPCIVVQRYNRARLLRVASLRARRRAGRPGGNQEQAA